MNDLIRLACERAVQRYDRSDNLFHAAGFSAEFTALAGVNGSLDGNFVRAMLSGRPDVEFEKSTAYFRLLPVVPHVYANKYRIEGLAEAHNLVTTAAEAIGAHTHSPIRRILASIERRMQTYRE